MIKTLSRGNTTLWVIISIIVIVLVIGAVSLLRDKNIASPDGGTTDTDEVTTDENMNIVILKTNKGDITLELFREDAPNTVENFEELVKVGFYDGTRFHRVIKDFMLQGGDPQSKDVALKDKWGTGGPGYAFPDEFNSNLVVRGALAMANSGPNTNGSQFFIVTIEAAPWLDGVHTVFGRVVDGMDIVDAIEALETDAADRPLQDVIIESVELKQ